jgi:hypothetical protein
MSSPASCSWPHFWHVTLPQILKFFDFFLPSVVDASIRSLSVSSFHGSNDSQEQDGAYRVCLMSSSPLSPTATMVPGMIVHTHLHFLGPSNNVEFRLSC